MLTTESVLVPTHPVFLPPSIHPSYYFNLFFLVKGIPYFIAHKHFFSGPSMYPEELYDIFKSVIALSF